MKIEKIKPIPKYMIKLIKKKDLKSCPAQNAVTRYYNYFTKNDGELVQVTVAVRNHKGKWFCKQVLVHGINSKTCFIKDMVCYIIAGYVTGWYDEGISKTRAYYNDGIWGWNDDKYFKKITEIGSLVVVDGENVTLHDKTSENLTVNLETGEVISNTAENDIIKDLLKIFGNQMEIRVWK